MVMVIGQATVNLPQREVRVLALDLIGVPVVRQTIQRDLKICVGAHKLNECCPVIELIFGARELSRDFPSTERRIGDVFAYCT